ncbi:MAG: excinuclease ABC subunit UvrA, partial [Roseiflexaceae bacterium]
MTATTRSKSLIIKGARENNLKNINVDIPREQLVVVTGLSGSGKSSLAFETIYAEGQRRFLESLSAYARRRVEQVKKPDVDFIYGLSPVVSIEQKTVGRNPRSTIGTMTDIYDFMRVLYTTAGVAHCPYCHTEVPIKTPHQIAEHLLALPAGASVEICAPVFKIYGEDYAYLLAEIRNRGHRRMYVDDVACDISEEMELDEARTYALEAVIDKFVVKHPGAHDRRRDLRQDIEQAIVTSIQNGLRVGEGFVRFRIKDERRTTNDEGPPEDLARAKRSLAVRPSSLVDEAAFFTGFACPQHHVTMGELKSYYFAFNDPDSACRSCSGLGTYYKVHPHLLVIDPARSIKDGCFLPEVYTYSRDAWPTKLMVSVAAHYDFSLDTPFKELPPAVVEIVFHGTRGARFPIVMPEGARSKDHTGMMMRFEGIINTIERRYKHYRQEQTAHTEIETYLKRVMVEHTCPDCNGTKLKRQRLLVTLKGRNIYDLGEMNLAELRAFLEHVPLPARQRQAGEQVIAEIKARLELLLGIGVDYLSLNRKAGTLSGGESQRIRLSNQIGSGLMGMLYVLDEPSIGLHPKDNLKMIRTLQRLRDIGNSVIVVEHDEDTIRAADYILEIGPGPGIHGGSVVAQGTIDEILGNPASLTGDYLSGRKKIALPSKRRPFSPAPAHPLTEEGVKGRTGAGLRPGWLRIVGARENNLKNLDVEIPLGLFICVTGASGSGKSSLINEILYKQLYSVFHDSRVLPGRHDRIEGLEQLTDVINIDQSPIGRTPRSNPATYIGFYDDIRRLFANTPESKARGYSMGRFSFNVKGGRCQECAGEGLITTSLHFMPDVESPCPICKGARYNQETLEVTYAGKNIAQILDMTVEEGETFFKERPYLVHKIGMLNALGLGYLRLGQSSTTLSGGEAQRIKLASELGKIKRGNHNFYILDEPTTGLHLADIQKLLDSLNRLVDAGNTVLVIEHHLDVIKTADYVIDLGPDGGHNGGEIIVQGTPEEVARCPRSYTGQYLRR